MDYLGTADYLTSPVSGKVEAWTHYNEWGLITHNAVLKCGQRELDLVKRYATHDYDSVLELYYAKARFYDAHDRRFTAVDPILDPNQYDLREYVKNPVQFVQYAYVQNQPLVYIDPTGEVAIPMTVLAITGVATSAYVAYVNFQNWVRSSEGQQVINRATKIIADSIPYEGLQISYFLLQVLLGFRPIPQTVIVYTKLELKEISKAFAAGAINSATQILVDDIDKTVTSYMDKVGCKGKNESDSNTQGGKSDSESNSNRKQPSTSNSLGTQKGDGGNGRKPIKPNQNPNETENGVKGTDSTVKSDVPTPSVPYPGDDPTKQPGPGWEWRGDPEKGSWYNPETTESLHPDLQHPDPIGPHWDYIPYKKGPGYRWYPDGRLELKIT